MALRVTHTRASVASFTIQPHNALTITSVVSDSFKLAGKIT